MKNLKLKLMIKKYKDFSINESSDIEDYDDIVYIFSEMTDEGFRLEVEKSFFTPSGYSRESEDTSHNIPGVKITLRKEIKSILSEDVTLNIVNSMSECVDKLSEFGDVFIKDMNLSYSPSGRALDSALSSCYIKILLLQKHKEVEVSGKPGFYDFVDSLKRNFSRLSNKVTNSFTIKSSKDEIILLPKDGVNSKQMLSATKSQLKKLYDPWQVSWRNRKPNHEFDYDVKLVDNDIHIIYKQKFQINRWGERIV